jgi:GDP-L-fucose synthase
VDKGKYLITGGTGFIGTRLTARLTSLFGEDCVVSHGRTYDLQDAECVGTLFGDLGQFDTIFHCADVQGNANWSSEYCADQFFDNTKIHLNVLNAWKQWQPQARLVAFSSLWAYPGDVSLAQENDYWNGRMHVPTEHYGLSKKIIGVGINSLKKQFGLQGTVLVLGSVYGPNDASFHVIPSIIQRMVQEPNRLEVWGNGTETRDFIFIEDQIEGIMANSHFNGELLNVGSGCVYTIREVVETLAKHIGYSGEIVFNPEKSSGVKKRRISVEMANQLHGWPSRFKLRSLDEGLRETVSWFLRERQSDKLS